MPKLTITRGLQASGKTSWAIWQVRHSGAVRVSRDDLRAFLFADAGVLPYSAEELITEVQRSTVRAALASGRDVVVDDMNLRAKYSRAWADLARDAGVEFHVEDFRTDVEECIRRDKARGLEGGRSVEERVIRETYRRYIAQYDAGGGWLPEVKPTPLEDMAPRWKTYVPDETLPPAWIVDLDGTLALKKTGEGSRGYYDWLRVEEDDPNSAVVELVRALYTSDYENEHDSWDLTVLALSGRMEAARPGTDTFLKREDIPHDRLFMRADGDQRADQIVKHEIFWRDIAPFYNVLGVIDDRDSVVAMWRAMGLTCFQCAPGDF